MNMALLLCDEQLCKMVECLSWLFNTNHVKMKYMKQNKQM